jgi:hypothetical protein
VEQDFSPARSLLRGLHRRQQRLGVRDHDPIAGRDTLEILLVLDLPRDDVAVLRLYRDRRQVGSTETTVTVIVIC